MKNSRECKKMYHFYEFESTIVLFIVAYYYFPLFNWISLFRMFEMSEKNYITA